MIRKLYKICEALENRFPGNRDPFRILARLMEESGELADQVHVREDVGRKRESGRLPDEAAMVEEIQDILTAVLDMVRFYHLEDRLAERVEFGYRRAVSEGLIAPLEENDDS
jgi:NTP pyrophosphatase (non-canonical NTP hydrolase)